MQVGDIGLKSGVILINLFMWSGGRMTSSSSVPSFMYYNYNIRHGNVIVRYNKCLGITYTKQTEDVTEPSSLPIEIQNPFIVCQRSKNNIKVHVPPLVKVYGYILVWCARYCYFLLYLLSLLRLDLFEDAQQASCAFQQATHKKKQNLLCLPRSVFIATTSRRFKEHGTMYIGVFWPSRNLHAWVIEDKLQTDEWDNSWILYQPLIMMKG